MPLILISLVPFAKLLQQVSIKMFSWVLNVDVLCDP